MNKKTRFIILYTLVFFFLFIGSYILISAQGFIFDIQNLKITKTGGLFLKFNPSDAKIFINDKNYAYSPNFIINNGILIKKLLPGEYKVSLYKENFQLWNKVLEVKPGLVTAESQIYLWPVIFEETPINKNILDFWNTKKGLIYKDLNKNLLFENSKIKGSVVLLNSEKSDFIVTTDTNNKFLINLNNPKTALNIDELFNSLKQHQLSFPGIVQIKNVMFHPFSEEKLIIFTNNSVYSLDTKKIQLEQLAAINDFSAAYANGNEVFTIDSKDKILILNLVLKNKNYLNLNLDSPISIKTNQNNSIILISDNKNNLTIYDRNLKTQKNIPDIKETALSQDGKRIIFANSNNEIFVYFLDNYEGDTKELKETYFQLGSLSNLSNLTWLNDKNYFLSLNGQNLWIYEIDKRLPINSYEISKNVKKYFAGKNEVYVLKENNELIKIVLK